MVCLLFSVLLSVRATDFETQFQEPLAANQFQDIKQSSWYYDAVCYSCDEAKLFAGISSTAFSPNTSMTRAMFVTVLGRKCGVDVSEYSGSNFTDVKVGLWYSPYIQWASECGLVTGVDASHFRPNAAITRGDIVMLLYRYAKRTKNDDSYQEDALHFYPDESSIAAHAKTAMKWAVTHGVISGYDNPARLYPGKTSTRAQVAQIFYNTRHLLTGNEMTELRPDYTTRDITVISHRGMPAEAPDHSFSGYDRAISAGSSYIEQDLYMSADGVLVVSHGLDLKEATQGAYTGNIESLNWEDIRKAKLWNGETIHSLKDVFERYQDSTNYVIETRKSSVHKFAAEDELLRLIGEYGLEDHVILQSFYCDSLRYMKKQSPHLSTLLLLDDSNSSNKLPDDLLNNGDVDSYAFDFSHISEKFIGRIHDKGKKVFVYSLDFFASEKLAKTNMIKVMNMGVDGFFTNHTRVAIPLVDQAHGLS